MWLTFMITHSVSAGKEHHNSTEFNQHKLPPHWPMHILAPCGDSSSHFCSASRKATTHTDVLYDDSNIKVATTNGAKSSVDGATLKTMRRRQRRWDDASAGAKMTKEEPKNKQP
eukprot:4462614-Ditylum_brightwellii.AAC.1